MNRRRTILGIASLGLVAFGGAAFLYRRPSATALPPAPTAPVQSSLAAPAQAAPVRERFQSPILGSASAPVTIVEFFDPACEACRAFYPIVKEILRREPGKVRVVLRYTAFHDVSPEAVRILETARLQGKFQPVLDALIEKQPEWASDGASNIDVAWQIAAAAGLDVTKARADANQPSIDSVLAIDAADVEAAGVQGTPTFYVNGAPLQKLGAQELYDMVLSKIAEG